ncbi:red-like protein [Niveomyces insectorum RCEF 264]|uniref:Red-like protein n=1 Tax=Niveomyces insectorum RCEF 264 TaxID=1081102 RepID=A0A168AEQ3_9HYPO|nr:red-like protein [Niveomyces insectorum RCEF 264]
MNNDQFRKLALGAGTSAGSNNAPSAASASPNASGVLGSRQKASLPMTPRSGSSVSRVAFAKQMAERFQDAEKQRRHRSSMPKGSRLAEGYVDRAKTRTAQEKKDEREARLAALEELYKKEEIDRTTYEKLQLEIAGGDLSSTHLVKGLDFKLLERVRKGEDVFDEKKAAEREERDNPDDDDDDDDERADDPAETAAEGAADVDDEFAQLEQTEVHAVEREKARKRGQLASTALAPGRKRTRDQILAELRATREAAKKKEESALGSRFKKIGATQTAGSRIERDSRGREVLVIVDQDGHEKRKVRRAAPGAEGSQKDASQEVLVQTKDAKVLGMEVPEFYRKKQEAEAAAAAAKAVDIFDDVSSDYDPLAGVDSSDSDSESEADPKNAASAEGRDEAAPLTDQKAVEASDRSQEEARPKPTPPTSTAQVAPDQTAPRRNYFSGSKLLSEESRSGPSLNDPSVLAALRKAKQMREASQTQEKSKEAEREARLRKLLQSQERDAADLDMGFGGNRLQDEEEAEEGDDVKLSTWKGGGDDDGGDGPRRGAAKRKRGPKRRKGDANSAADVMRIVEEKRREA